MNCVCKKIILVESDGQLGFRNESASRHLIDFTPTVLGEVFVKVFVCNWKSAE